MIVGINNNSILDFKVEIETNHIKLYLQKGNLNKIEEFIKVFNVVSWEDKVKDILDNEDTDENVVRNKIKEFIEKETDLNLFSFDDFVFEDENFNNIRNYKGNSIDVVDNIRYFTNKVLPTQVIDMISDFAENIEGISIKDAPLNSFLTGISEFVLYMGPNEKYRGCVGRIVRTRDKASSLLVEFPNKFRESGNIARFWSKPENIISFLE